MVDVVIIKSYKTGQASVYAETKFGRWFLSENIKEHVNKLTVPNELVDEFAADLKNLNGVLQIEIR